MMLSRWGQRSKSCRLSLPALSLEAFKHCGVTKGAQPLAIHASGGGKLGWGRSRTPAASSPGIRAQPAPVPNLFVPAHALAGLAPPLRRRRRSPSARRHRRRVWRPAAAAAAGGARGGGGGRLCVGSFEEQPPRGHHLPSACLARPLARGPWTDW